MIESPQGCKAGRAGEYSGCGGDCRARNWVWFFILSVRGGVAGSSAAGCGNGFVPSFYLSALARASTVAVGSTGSATGFAFPVCLFLSAGCRELASLCLFALGSSSSADDAAAGGEKMASFSFRKDTYLAETYLRRAG